jgi:hypothetical protein
MSRRTNDKLWKILCPKPRSNLAVLPLGISGKLVQNVLHVPQQVNSRTLTGSSQLLLRNGQIFFQKIFHKMKKFVRY